ncbi:hypothetical protein KUTeg_007938 [Tegillarca granosa]|uniref:Uncharacterized protein n=1 Tax=Tegillarca granosa TaxID=220873 RepID=A0ABQ9FEN0_TEGGR|nr:hypothetical protein KUTeg_007938 [Tegillarca granosa]
MCILKELVAFCCFTNQSHSCCLFFKKCLTRLPQKSFFVRGLSCNGNQRFRNNNFKLFTFYIIFNVEYLETLPNIYIFNFRFISDFFSNIKFINDFFSQRDNFF